jgi:hypothetical protein
LQFQSNPYDTDQCDRAACGASKLGAKQAAANLSAAQTDSGHLRYFARADIWIAMNLLPLDYDLLIFVKARQCLLSNSSLLENIPEAGRGLAADEKWTAQLVA